MDSDFVFLDEENDTDKGSRDAGAPWQILIVDDDPSVHSATRFAFANETHCGRAMVFRSAFSGLEALSLILDSKDSLPDLVLMDVVMTTPTDGIDTTHRIRQFLDQRQIPYIIVRTGQAGTILDTRALIHDPDIDQVLFKQEATAERLRTAIFAGLDRVASRKHESPRP